MIKKVEYLDQWSYKMYKYWLEEFNEKTHNKLILRLKKFIDSKKFRLRRSC